MAKKNGPTCIRHVPDEEEREEEDHTAPMRKRISGRLPTGRRKGGAT
jgi:hypothetical protein